MKDYVVLINRNIICINLYLGPTGISSQTPLVTVNMNNQYANSLSWSVRNIYLHVVTQSRTRQDLSKRVKS